MAVQKLWQWLRAFVFLCQILFYFSTEMFSNKNYQRLQFLIFVHQPKDIIKSHLRTIIQQILLDCLFALKTSKCLLSFANNPDSDSEIPWSFLFVVFVVYLVSWNKHLALFSVVIVNVALFRNFFCCCAFWYWKQTMRQTIVADSSVWINYFQLFLFAQIFGRWQWVSFYFWNVWTVSVEWTHLLLIFLVFGLNGM